MLKLELEMSGIGRLFLVLSVEERKERVQKWCFFSVCVDRICVYTMYSKCVYQSETNIRREGNECKKMRYCPVGLRQS